MGFNDEPMIKQKDYSKEKYKAKKIKSFGVAKRIIVMCELCYISLVNTCVSLGLSLLLLFGTSALPFFDINIDFGAETFILRGGLFISLCIVFVLGLTISGFWYAIGYKRLEIMCIHLDGELEGAIEVNEAAQRDTLRNSFENIAGLEPTHFSSLSGPVGLAENYLTENNTKMVNTSILKGINAVLILGQITIAVVCVVTLIINS